MQTQQPNPPQPNYGFILDPPKPAKPSLFNGFNGSSLKQRLIVVGGGLVILIIVASVIANLLSSSDDYLPGVLAVAQEQQELVHLATTVSGIQTQLSATNANLAVTIQLTASSSQADLLNYLKKNGHKVSTAQLNQKVSTNLDQQLNTAAQAGTYDSTFDSLVQSQLTTYQQYINQALAKDKGPNGQKLLNGDLQQAQLLLTSLTTPSQ